MYQVWDGWEPYDGGVWSTFTRRGGWWVAAQAVVMALMAGSWFVSDGDWGTWSWVVGWALAGAGLVVGAWAMLALGDNLTPYPSPRQGTELVERGPYRVARHPIYGAIVLGSVGLSLVAGSGPGLALAGVLAALFTAKSSVEERHLAASVPGYDAYRRRVRGRLLPFVP